jgi:hypothetical protein
MFNRLGSGRDPRLRVTLGQLPDASGGALHPPDERNLMKKLLALVSICAALGSAQTVNGRLARVQFKTLASSGTTSAFDVSRLSPSQHTLQAVSSGSPTRCTIQLQGSLDGTTWFDLSGSQTCTSTLMVHVEQRPVSYVRANLTALSGGTTPKVAIFYLGVQ